MKSLGSLGNGDGQAKELCYGKKLDQILSRAGLSDRGVICRITVVKNLVCIFL